MCSSESILCAARSFTNNWLLYVNKRGASLNTITFLSTIGHRIAVTFFLFITGIIMLILFFFVEVIRFITDKNVSLS